MPLNVKKSLLKARNLEKQGNQSVAVDLYREILASFPQNRPAQQALARLGASGAIAGESAATAPREAVMQAVGLFQAGDLTAAIKRAEALVAKHPDDPMLQNFVGVVNAGLGNTEAAVNHYRKAVRSKPTYAEAHYNLGIALYDLGQNSAAQSAFTRVIKLEPNNAGGHCGLANTLRDQGKYEKAIASYTTALKLQPRDAIAHNNLGNTLSYLGRDAEAARSFVQSVNLDRGNAEAHYNLGNALNEQGEIARAIACYEQSLKLNPGLDDAQAKILHLRALSCDWSEPEPDQSTLGTLGIHGEAVTPFIMLAQEDHPARNRIRSEVYSREKFRNHTPGPAFTPPKQTPKKIRIGYFSADFYSHATMHLMAKVFELHDHQRFEIHAFSFGPERDDEYVKRLKCCVSQFHDVRDQGEAAIAELARKQKIDIAVDLKGFTQHGRAGIFACGAAPIQISYLGYPGTMGMPSMDYIVADAVVIPDSQREHYCEKVIYLPGSYQANDCDKAIAPGAMTREDAGLPESGFVFCCFNNNYKIKRREFDIWMRLLQQVDGSVLWLLSSNTASGDNLRQAAEARGVAGERIVLAEKRPLDEHLARHRLADLFLDTFNYNAHTTASDALWAGLPVLTRAGEGFAARVGASLLTAVGLPELITQSDEEYEDLALKLAGDPAELGHVRAKLATNIPTSPLFDSAGFTRHLEQAYTEVYGRHLQGDAPADISISA